MTLKAGAAVVDISPGNGVALYGYPHVERLSTGVHDPLLASALCLDNGRQKVLLVALDLLMIDPPVARAMRRAVALATGIPGPQVLISCTHTHSGPVSGTSLSWSDDPTVPPPDPAYLERVTQSIVQAATEALAARRPAKLAWTAADARGVGGNRISPDGVVDPEVGILSLRTAEQGEPLAVVLIYAMHPTVLHEDSTLVSSDFPHYARQTLRERFGASLPVLYHTAPCGNQSPRFFVQGQTFAEAERLGRKLGNAAAASLERLTEHDYTSECRLDGVLATIELPRRRFPAVAEAERLVQQYRDDYARLQREKAEKTQVRSAECAVFGAEGTLCLARLQEAGTLDRAVAAARPIELQLLQIGDVSLLGLPGEWFADYALELKRRWPGKLLVIALVNGHLQGYITTAEAAARGGYEALNAVLDGPKAGPLAIEAALQLPTLLPKS